MIEGTDTSFWVTSIRDEKLKKRVYKADFSKVLASRMKFCIIKATGCNPLYKPAIYTDIMYEQTLADARLLMPTSAYHWFDPRISYEDQVRYFISTVCKFEGGAWKYLLHFRPWCDVEVLAGSQTMKETANRIHGWLEMFADKTGVLPGIYTRKSIWDYLPKRNWHRYDNWLARYSNLPPELPYGFNDWTFWQHCAGGVPIPGYMPGLTGEPDRNYFNPNLDWDEYVKDFGPKQYTVLKDAPMNVIPEIAFEVLPVGTKFILIKTEKDEYGNTWGCYNEEKHLWVMMKFGSEKLVE